MSYGQTTLSELFGTTAATNAAVAARTGKLLGEICAVLPPLFKDKGITVERDAAPATCKGGALIEEYAFTNRIATRTQHITMFAGTKAQLSAADGEFNLVKEWGIPEKALESMSDSAVGVIISGSGDKEPRLFVQQAADASLVVEAVPFIVALVDEKIPFLNNAQRLALRL